MELRRSFLVLATFASVSFLSAEAWADKVAVLPFSSTSNGSVAQAGQAGGATVSKSDLDDARTWTRSAVTRAGHTLPSEAETLAAEKAVKDGVPDTSEEYRAAGRAAGSPWTVTGRVERTTSPASVAPDGTPRAATSTERLELVACQVGTGRVESLARNVSPSAAEAQIQEMLALLLRPEGIANAELPWKDEASAPEPPPSLPPESPPKTETPPPEHGVATEPPVASEPPKDHAYAEGHPVALGVSIGLSGALVRPSGARGSTLALPIGGTLAYALDTVPGLEFRGIFTTQVAGPRALEVAGGARYAIPVAPRYRLFVGPELLLGVHGTLGASNFARFLMHGSAFAALGIGERFQVELAGDLATAFGGSGTLVLGGATARALVRF